MNSYIGMTLGAYQVVEQVGQGGMATVYKAYQASMDRYVAIKVLPTHFTQDATFVARFNQEARVLARLEHPHILPVYDYGEQEGITYLVMRYINAGTLRDLITQRGRLPLQEIVRLVGQVGRALNYAHTQGIIHRDVKPSNVLVDQEGNAFLTDFGIAKLVAGAAQFTGTGAIVGTPAYMAPEQGLGRPLDGRCDVYALGIMLYEMTTGVVPYDADTPLAVVMKHVTEPLPLPSRAHPALPEGVEPIILKAMAKAPEERYQTAAELVEALERVGGAAAQTSPAMNKAAATEALDPPWSDPARTAILETHTPPAPIAPPPPPLLPQRAKARPLALVWLGLALLVVVALGGVGLMWMRQHSSNAVTPATPLTPGWTNYSNANFVRDMALTGSYLWVGGEGGLVRWNLEDQTYTRFGVSEGLPANQVHDLLADREGRVWAATDAGVSLFEGESWRTFTTADGLESDEITTLYEDEEGNIWAGLAYAEHGLNYYDGTRWQVPEIPPLPLENSTPWAIAGSRKTGMVIGTDFYGLEYFDGENWRVLTPEESNLPQGQIYDMVLVDDTTVLISLGYESYRLDLENWELELIPEVSGLEIECMMRTANDDLWFGGGGGLLHYHAATQQWERIEAESEIVPSWKVMALQEDVARGGVWIGAYDNGVIFYDGVEATPWRTSDRIPANTVVGIEPSGDGALWIMHEGHGLSRYTPESEEWQTFNAQDGAVDWPTSEVAVDDEGVLWVGDYGEIRYYNGTNWQSVTAPALNEVSILGIVADDDETLWLWSSDRIIRHKANSSEWAVFDSDDNPVLDWVERVYIDADENVWAGGDAGLVQYVDGEWAPPPGKGPQPQENVTDIAADNEGGVWIIADARLYHYHDDVWQVFENTEVIWPTSLAIGPDGKVWLGYNSLASFDPQTGSWRLYTTADGLIHATVNDIYVTPDNVVWIATPGGLSRFVPTP